MTRQTSEHPALTRKATLIPKAPLCRFEDLAPGRSRGFDPLDEGRDTMFIVRQGDRLYAYRNDCPHQHNARMAWKKNEFLNSDRTRITCSAHGATFAIDTGLCDGGPCVGERLEPVPIEIRDGDVYITAPYRPGRPALARTGGISD